jgi:hypothetical protein
MEAQRRDQGTCPGPASETWGEWDESSRQVQAGNQAEINSRWQVNSMHAMIATASALNHAASNTCL